MKLLMPFLAERFVTGNNDRKEIGNRMIVDFDHFCNELYKKGMQTFLNGLGPGDHETLHTHVLNCYFYQILKRIYSKYEIGLDIYTMYGFETIN